MLNVIEAMQLAPEIVYPLYLAAASDRYSDMILKVCINRCGIVVVLIFPILYFYSSQESVVKKGEELLKRKSTGVNLEDTSLIKKLFTLFNGTPFTQVLSD